MNITGHEPHPTLEMPDEAMAEFMGKEWTDRVFAVRRETMVRMDADPLRYGAELDVWKLADERLLAFRKRFPKDVLIELDLGGNRAAKSERRAKRLVENMVKHAGWRAWACQATETSSVQNQQSIVYKYLPREWKPESGKLRHGVTTKIVYSQSGGFTENVLTCPNGSECRFKFYEMKVKNLEGSELDEAWCDELVPIDWIEALIFRLVTRAGTKPGNGLLGITFTPIEGYSSTVKVHLNGAITVEEVDAELLPNLSGVVEMQTRDGAGTVPEAWASQDQAMSPDVVAGAKPAASVAVTGDWKRAPRDPASSAQPAQNNFSRPTFSAQADDDKRTMAATVGEGTAPKPVQVNAGASVGRPNSGDEIPRANFEKGGDALCRESAHNAANGTLLDTAPPSKAAPNGSSPSVAAQFEKVPRVQENLHVDINGQRAKACIIYFHTKDNPFGNYESMAATLEGASRDKILTRAYGVPTKAMMTRFPLFSDLAHVISLNRFREIQKGGGSWYHFLDPCSGRNWFQLWVFVDVMNRAFVAGESPSYDHDWAYIPGVGNPGPWAVAGGKADGEQGDGQKEWGWGYARYLEEIERMERLLSGGLNAGNDVPEADACQPAQRIEISARWIDARYGNARRTSEERSTTLIEDLSVAGMDFMAAPSEKAIDSGRGGGDGSLRMINDKLFYDAMRPIDHTNQPHLYVVETCPNTIYGLKEWTGKDGQHGACKDPIDCLRMLVLSGSEYVDPALLQPLTPWLQQFGR